ncbi:PREDICTED: UDP-glycosyltransferase 90A1 [Theobroma cacao]|uniref:Glycosyltransferase n=1 Tax=Theobroma cacao TaxID=3641 RepID=A0AB32W9L0_THECC|nr:PREDICTED: UDP-glycosyltransferase 90A1 [Theobroma cacao]
MDTISSNCSSHHAVLFPFMSKGHTIPILHLARLLLRRGLAVTVFTTPGNRPFIAKSLADTSASIIDINYPENIPEIPAGVESTDALPSISLFVPFCAATKLMQHEFERKLQSLLPVSFVVSDGFLWWTLESATKFGLPRLMFNGMSQYASTVSKAVAEDRLLFGPESDDELITVTQFPWIRVTRNDFEPILSSKPDPDSPPMRLFMDQVIAAENSKGKLVNSFYELEKYFFDSCNLEERLKAWSVGPLCLSEPPKVEHEHEPKKKPSWIKWLDQKLDEGCSVLYVAFGSQADISSEQLKQIATGLEESKVNFLWVVRKKESELGEGFEERVKETGIVVREWVDQKEILMHQSVQGFLSHCGWNSVLESICAGVPILAWPMMADQPLNARMVVEEIKVGLRVETCDGTVKGLVKWEGLMKMVRELMEGEMGKEVRIKVKELAELAKMAMEENTGSSWRTLDMLINEFCNNK